MKIAILGSRGIPNRYGGFEEFAEKLAIGLVGRDVDVSVYNPHHHPYKDDYYEGVRIIRKYDPVKFLKSGGQYIYDLACIMDSRRRNFDIVYQLGYPTSSVWFGLNPKNTVLITNIDGLEWKRAKYNVLLKKIIRMEERLAVKRSDIILADSRPIKEYVETEYSKNAVFIPYGSDTFKHPDATMLEPMGLSAGSYNLAIARFVPENNLETIIQGHIQSNSEHPLVIIGNHKNVYGRMLSKKYQGEKVIFTGALFERQLLDNLRFHSKVYFHGHSAGGTNPSLLEAMGANAFICAHNNGFNRDVLKDNAGYFDSAWDISNFLLQMIPDSKRLRWAENNRRAIEEQYSWDRIIDEYHALFLSATANND